MIPAANEHRRRAVDAIGPLPISITRLLAVTAAPDFDFGEVVDIVAHDMLLTGAILRSANSVASAPAQQIYSVRAAVTRIGAVQTMAVAMSSVVGSTFQGVMSRYGIGSTHLWTHSCAASIAAGEIRTRSQLSLPASTPTTALLHDIGKVVLDRVPIDERHRDIAMLVGHGTDICQIEEEIFGIDHAGMGAMTAEMWSLPPAIVEGIAGHHRLLDDPLPAAICLSDHIAHRTGDDVAAIDATSGHAQRAAAILGITSQQVDDAVDATRLQLDDLAHRYPAASEDRR